MKSKSGFTLVEVLIVVIALSILASIVVIAFGLQQRESRDTNRAVDILSLSEEFERYYQQHGNYPLTCGITTISQLSCGSSQISDAYSTPPPTISSSTGRSQLGTLFPTLANSFGDPRASEDATPINRGAPIETSSYFVLSPDMLPNIGHASQASGTVSFYTNPSRSSTFQCNVTLQANRRGTSNARPHQYVMGYYSEHESDWRFYISPPRADVNNLSFTSPAGSDGRCSTRPIVDLRKS